MMYINSDDEQKNEILHFRLSNFIAKNLPDEYCIKFVRDNYTFFYISNHHTNMIKQKLKWLHHRLVLADEEI